MSFCRPRRPALLSCGFLLGPDCSRVPSSASLGLQDFLRENHKGENDIIGPGGAICLQRIGLRKTPIKSK